MSIEVVISLAISQKSNNFIILIQNQKLKVYDIFIIYIVIKAFTFSRNFVGLFTVKEKVIKSV